MKAIKKPDEVPVGHHFVIIVYGKMSVPDGWGDTYEEDVATHYAIQERSEWETEIVRLLSVQKSRPWLRNVRERDGFVAFEVNGLAKIEMKVSVS